MLENYLDIITNMENFVDGVLVQTTMQMWSMSMNIHQT